VEEQSTRYQVGGVDLRRQSHQRNLCLVSRKRYSAEGPAWVRSRHSTSSQAGRRLAARSGPSDCDPNIVTSEHLPLTAQKSRHRSAKVLRQLIGHCLGRRLCIPRFQVITNQSNGDGHDICISGARLDGFWSNEPVESRLKKNRVVFDDRQQFLNQWYPIQQRQLFAVPADHPFMKAITEPGEQLASNPRKFEWLIRVKSRKYSLKYPGRLFTANSERSQIAI